MKRSTDRILTTHVGSMPRPAELRAMDTNAGGRIADQAAYDARLRTAVDEIVRKQAEVGYDVINDGEIYKPSWSGYVRERLAGFELRPGEAFGRGIGRGREADEFAGYFRDRSISVGGIGGGGLGQPAFGAAAGSQVPPIHSGPVRPPEAPTMMVCTGPISYVGQAQAKRDVENLKAALKNVDVEDVFMAAVGPDNVGYNPGQNQYYATEEEYIIANAKALHEEYKAITDAGFVVQIDTPVMKYNALNMTLESFRKRFASLVDILNDTLSDIPEEQIRLHICFGGGRGPHTGDIMLKDFMDLVLKIKSTGISLDQDVRHEHEWTIWQEMKLPEGKVLIPGVIMHTTDTVEHPELVAQRLVRWANLVGRENVMAGTDCGLGGRVHPDIVWAKSKSIVEGARIASKQLWGK
ncbi:MAG TPA: cobalamin-independent methionine synthase II family protein [Dehalococcoidia bacterium]|nr:cobalamin-independent methionine synthase II family protein [Dehalococcoidia bacterium]